MTNRLTGPAFLASPGVEGWRALWGGGWAMAHYGTRSFPDAVELACAIGELATRMEHRAELDVREGGVTVRLYSGEWEGLSAADIELAQLICVKARELGAVAEPNGTQHVQISIDALDVPRVQRFWSAVLGYSSIGDTDVLDPLRRGPTLSFHQMAAPRAERNRIHVDVYVPPDQVDARIQAGLAAGGRIVYDNSPLWWTLADPEGNEVDLAIWMDD